jgi:leader peptidase (prepilin peptidase) / N-methyltransferase
MTGLAPLLVIGLFGGIIGSFLNVCIYRVPIGKSVVSPPSSCPACGRRLSWYENIPVVSYLALGGRCRGCRTGISARYPIVEATTAFFFAAAYWHYGPSLLLVSRLVFVCLLIVLFAIDLELQLLPYIITLPAIVVGLLFSLATEPGWLPALLGALIGYGILWAIAAVYFRLRHEQGLGEGDPPMLAMIGAFLGWKLTLVTLMMASFAGSIVGVGLIVLGRGHMKLALPFGTFLAIGAVLAATIGPGLLEWYLRLW